MLGQLQHHLPRHHAQAVGHLRQALQAHNLHTLNQRVGTDVDKQAPWLFELTPLLQGPQHTVHLKLIKKAKFLRCQQNSIGRVKLGMGGPSNQGLVGINGPIF